MLVWLCTYGLVPAGSHMLLCGWWDLVGGKVEGGGCGWGGGGGRLLREMGGEGRVWG